MNTSHATSGPAPIALRGDEGEAIWFLDFLATIKSSAETTGGRVAVIEHLAGRKDAGSPLHVHHREDEWFLEGFMRACAEPARARTLPPPPSEASQAPDPVPMAALAAEYGIDILGPPGISS